LDISTILTTALSATLDAEVDSLSTHIPTILSNPLASTELACLEPLSLCALWLGIKIAPLKLFVLWGEQQAAMKSRGFEVKLLTAMRHLASFLNLVSPFVVDMDGDF
jgi:hypothetical protein